MLELDGTVPASSDFVTSFQSRITAAKRCLEAAQQRAESDSNAHRRMPDPEIAEGTLVLLNTKNINTNVKGPRKLLPKWIGPFPVAKLVGKAAVKLTLPSDYRIHNVFHVSLVKHYKQGPGMREPPPVYWDEQGASFNVDRILDHRDKRYGKRTVREYLVRWEGYGPEHNSWEPAANFHSDLLPRTYCEQRKIPLAPPRGGRSVVPRVLAH